MRRSPPGSSNASTGTDDEGPPPGGPSRWYKRRVRRAGLLLVLLVAGCGAHSVREVPASKAKELVLQPTDLRKGFVSIGSGARNPFTASSTDPKRFDREGGWFADYRRPPPATRGALIVQSEVDVFGDEKGAAKEVDADRNRLGRSNSISVPRIGDESSAARVVGSGSPPAVVYTLVWRQRNVASSLVVTGLEGKLEPGEPVALARKAAARVDAALR
jgi:hypothetical protein